VEDQFDQPELPVLLKDLVVNLGRYLELAQVSLRQLTFLVFLLDQFLVNVYVGIVHELIEALHIDYVFTLIDQDVCILSLHQVLLHFLIVTDRLTIVQVIHQNVIVSSKGLLRNVIRVKVLHILVIEFEPVACRPFPFLD